MLLAMLGETSPMASSLLRALGRLVRAAGFAVKTFASAEEFMVSDRSVPPRCLVLDVRLGGIDGFELHDRLLASGTAPPAPRARPAWLASCGKTMAAARR